MDPYTSKMIKAIYSFPYNDPMSCSNVREIYMRKMEIALLEERRLLEQVINTEDEQWVRDNISKMEAAIKVGYEKLNLGARHNIKKIVNKDVVTVEKLKKFIETLPGEIPVMNKKGSINTIVYEDGELHIG